MNTEIRTQEDAAGLSTDGRYLYDGWSEMLSGLFRRGTEMSDDVTSMPFVPVAQGALGDSVEWH